ncbi:MAG: tetratricopeptide repeat protein, partial [Gemmatimonadaceae bacterium]
MLPVALVAVAALTAVAFAPALSNGFVSWDDQKNFLDNPNYRGLGLSQLGWMWTTFHLGHYVPLTWMSLGFDYTLWGMNPMGYHATSVVLHAVNASLVFLIARRVFIATADAAVSQERVVLAAAASALAFAIHPLRVESVAWVTERRDVLSLLFYLASVLAYLRACEPDDVRPWYWISVGVFACALLSKATAMTLPAVLLLLNVYPLARIGGRVGWKTPAAWRVYRELIPFAVLSAATVILSLVALHPPAQLGLFDKVVVSVFGLSFYLWKSIAPWGLSPLYPMPAQIDATEPRFLASYVVVAALVAFIIWIRRSRPGVAAVLVAFVVMTLPMLGVVQNGPQIAADRYTYFGAVALSLLVGGAFLMWRFTMVTTATAALLLATLGALTWEQTSVWHDSEGLWQRVLALDDQAAIAHSAMASLMFARDNVSSGIEQSRRAIALAPDFAEAHNDLGVGLSRTGQLADAIAEFERAIAISPAYDEAYSNLGVALAHQGNLAGAMTDYRRALELNPDNADAHVDLGNAMVRLDRSADAIDEYEAAIRIRPDHAEARFNWGVALAREGRFADAIEQFRATLAIDPGHAEASRYLERATRLLQSHDSTTAQR